MEATEKPKKKDHSLRNFLIKLAVTALCIWLALTFVLGVYRLSGNEMYPALRDGDLCITYRLDAYHSGDVVAYREDGGIRFARIVARAGDTVNGDEIGLIINGARPLEEIFYLTNMNDSVLELPCTLEDGQVLVLNDFRSDTGDSRQYGILSTDELEGKVIMILRRRGI